MIQEELRRRWDQEELLILERGPAIHDLVAAKLEEAGEEIEAEVGCLIGQGLAQVPTPAGRRTAALAVWARLKESAPAHHARQAEELIERLAEDPWAIVYLKALFKILAAQQGQADLLASSYLRE